MNPQNDTSTTAGKIADLQDRLAKSRQPAGEDAVRAVHGAGRLTARERVEALLDDGSFVEIDALARHRSKAFDLEKERPLTDGVVTGHGTIDGRPVCVFSQDATLFEGKIGETTGAKIIKVLELALKSGTPVIGFYDGAGARLKEGIIALDMYSRILRLQSQASGVIPQIAVVAGECRGVQVHGIAMSDIVISVDGQGSLSMDANPGGVVEIQEPGTAHIVVPDESAAQDTVADVLSYLPSNNRAIAPATEPVNTELANRHAEEGADEAALVHEINRLIPDSASETYDVRDVLAAVLDEDSLLELGLGFAPNIITGFARLEGRAIGVIANQPTVKAGGIDIDSAEKVSYFIQLCDAFNVPLVSFVDAPGFLPEDADAPVIRRTAKLFHTTAAASVGKITVITRKATGSAYLALAAKRMGTDLVFAWPTAEVAVADADTFAAEIGADEAAAQDPYEAAASGLVDVVLPPSETRQKLAEGLGLLERKVEDGYPRKHGIVTF